MTSTDVDNGAPSPLIPRRLLFADSAVRAPRLSPDGRSIGYLARSRGALNVWVQPVGGGTTEAVTHEVGQGVRQFFYCHDRRHLAYLTDETATESWRLHLVDLAGGTTKTLPIARGVQLRIIAHNPHRPEELILGLNDRRAELHDVYRYEISSGRIEKILDNPGLAGFFVDAGNRLRGGVRFRSTGEVEVLIRAGVGADEWNVVYELAANEAAGGPLGFCSGDREVLLLTAKDAPTLRLVALDVSSRETRVLAEDPNHDVANVVLHPRTSDVQLVSFRRERTEWRVLDESVASDIEALQQVDRGDFTVLSRDDADTRWLVYFDHDREPPSYYLWDRGSQHATQLFGHARRGSGYRFSRVEPFSFTARDGLRMHGYLTPPVDASAGPLPTVVMVHGGPWTRDTWGFQPQAQWLANRGYLCVQINFRGSMGYGKEFLNRGNHQWGLDMQRDLVDGVHHLVAEGVTDVRRVGIFGHSYGGYAALVGATMPQVFACAVAVGAPVDLCSLIASLPPARRAFAGKWHIRVGDPRVDAASLRSRSPVEWTQDVVVPLFIAHGTNDARASYAEVETWVQQLRECGASVEFRSYAGEGHSLIGEESRLDFYEHAESFLARHLGGRFEHSAVTVGA